MCRRKVLAALKNEARRLSSREIKAKSTVWATVWFSELVFGLLRVRDKQVMNEDSVACPECRAVTLHGEHLYPTRTITAFLFYQRAPVYCTMFTRAASGSRFDCL